MIRQAEIRGGNSITKKLFLTSNHLERVISFKKGG